MVDTNKKVIGSYATRDEALDVVHRLKEKGFQKQNIILYSNEDTASTLGDHEAVDVVADNDNATAAPDRTDDDKSMWDKIKDAFTDDTYEYDERTRDTNYNQDDDVLYPYRDDISNGNIVVVVDNAQNIDLDDFNSSGALLNSNREIPNPDANAAHTDLNDRDLNRTDDDLHTKDVDRADHTDDKIRLKEEQLEVDKNEVTTGEVNVHKEVVKDTETVEVPVEREEVVIDRKPVTDSDRAATDDIKDEETINIPIKEEQIEVTKKPVVKEEVEVRKEHHTDTKKVSEEVRHEELDVDTEGDVRVDDGGTDMNRKDTHTGTNTPADTPTDLNAPRDSNDDLLTSDDDPGLTDKDTKRDLDDPLTEGRKYSREDEDLDGFKR